MARILIDGFESAAFQSRYPYISSIGHTTRSGFNGYCLNMTNNTAGLGGPLPSSYAALYFARKVEFSSCSTNSIIQFGNGSTLLGRCRLYSASGNRLQVSRGTTTLATGTFAFNNGNVYLIEGYYEPRGDGSGRWIIWINGSSTPDIDYTGQTAPSTVNIDRWGIGYNVYGFGTSDYGYQYADDVIMDDANRIGNTTIQGRTLNADEGTPQWSRSAGSNNYETVDEIPPNEADYNYVNAVDQLDLFGCAALGTSPGPIKCMKIDLYGLKTGNPTPTQVKPVVKSGATPSEGAAADLPLTAGYITGGLWETDPNTGSAWTESGVNNSKVGYKSAA